MSSGQGAERPTNPLISLDHVSFGYPGQPSASVLGDISLSVMRGETLSIVGPSGCGKSTLLRLIAGLGKPGGGQLSRSDFNPEVHSRQCTMVFQEDTLLPWLRVRDNVGLSFRFQKRRGREIQERIKALVKMVGLDGWEDSYPYELSGGMKRRVALLTGIAPLPELLLLDEPFSALDEPTRLDIHAEMYAILQEYKIATLLVTHDLAEALSLSNRILMLSVTPATIVEEFQVPFGTDRDMLSLRSDPRFLEMYGNLWRSLKRETLKAR